MNLEQLNARQADRQGEGHFGASRGSRTHGGIDLSCPVGTEIHAPISGEVTKIGYPYGDEKKIHFRYVEVMNGGYSYRVFYISPLVKVGDVVDRDTIIGKSQCLSDFYTGITEHVHFEIKDGAGDKIDPTPVVLMMREFLTA